MIDPLVYSHQESVSLGAPRHIPFKMHCSNVGFMMLEKKGWEPGKGLGPEGKGRTEPYLPDYQCGAQARLGLGCRRCTAMLTGKNADLELRVSP